MGEIGRYYVSFGSGGRKTTGSKRGNLKDHGIGGKKIPIKI